MPDLVIHNAIIVNEGQQFIGSVVVDKEKILNILPGSTDLRGKMNIDAAGLYLIPGIIDDQVHFREPGLTNKGDIWHESRAAAAGGVTSFMDMPNTKPQTITQKDLKDKFELGRQKSLINYSFYIGATNDNLLEVLETDPLSVCGIKLFLGSSTGNMLVDNTESLKKIFSQVRLPIAVHCEDENTIRENTAKAKSKFGEQVPFSYHPVIRDEKACYLSTAFAVKLAKEYDTRLHVLHLSTGKELELFEAGGNLKTKKITCEVCVHHLWFNESDYETKGAMIKWNPAIKSAKDQQNLMQGLINDRIDVIATDHAPHTLQEKNNTYFYAPSGGPLVQHSLPVMLEFYKKGSIPLEKIVQKMCHAPADIFQVSQRGYIRQGYWADLVLVDLNKNWRVSKENILSKCGWSPFEGTEFSTKVHTTIVNGSVVYSNDIITECTAARTLEFYR
jgi:dihydroorotase